DYLQVCDNKTAFAQLSGALAKDNSGLSADLLQTVLNGDEWLSYIENWRQQDGTAALEVHTYDRQGRLRVGTKRAQTVRSARGSTKISGEPKPPRRPPGLRRAQNGDRSQLDGTAAPAHSAAEKSGQNGQ